MRKNILEEFDKRFGYDLMEVDNWSLDSINELKKFILWVHREVMNDTLKGMLVFPDPIFIEENIKIPRELMKYIMKEVIKTLPEKYKIINDPRYTPIDSEIHFKEGWDECLERVKNIINNFKI